MCSAHPNDQALESETLNFPISYRQPARTCRSCSDQRKSLACCSYVVKTYTILAEKIPPDKLTIDCRRPQRLYRYSNAIWLERSLKFGEFRLCPAADYKDLLNDPARTDDELVRLQSTEGKYVRITHVE